MDIDDDLVLIAGWLFVCAVVSFFSPMWGAAMFLGFLVVLAFEKWG